MVIAIGWVRDFKNKLYNVGLIYSTLYKRLFKLTPFLPLALASYAICNLVDICLHMWLHDVEDASFHPQKIFHHWASLQQPQLPLFSTDPEVCCYAALSVRVSCPTFPSVSRTYYNICIQILQTNLVSTFLKLNLARMLLVNGNLITTNPNKIF